MNSLGNPGILKNHKTAFLCSRRYPASIVSKAYDWAIAQREAGNCIISGFHSQIEKDVFHFLLKGTQPIIMALARGLPRRLDRILKKEIDNERLLLVTPFEKYFTRVTVETAFRRNKFMLELADEIVVAHASAGGRLEKLLRQVKNKEIRGLVDDSRR
jgi:predicted Rossmann fold nucleotide-binding protein DprA/Smf involved in DNA uptake